VTPLLSALTLSLAAAGPAASPTPSSELLARLHRLHNPARVLYVAAHPDDENTRLIAWLVGARGYDVTYLSLTRGGGGQNLIGDEQAELLGVVRTGELLAARSVDGGRQRFTRARDFGYSKSAEESLAIWGEDEVLRDVVRTVREVRPEVVITRFGPDDDSHGHHVASARLAARAVALAADPSYTIDGTRPWTVDRAYRNESHWRIDDDTDTSGWHQLDVGSYDPLTGQSWGEVAATSRTMHKSQGFGAAPRVGPQLEYFSVLAGIPDAMAERAPPVGTDPLAGLPTRWADHPGGAAVDKALARARRRFDPADPAASTADLLAVASALDAVASPAALPAQLAVRDWLLDALGLWITARAERPDVRPGGTVPVELTILQRSGAPGQVTVEGVEWIGAASDAVVPATPLAPHEPLAAELTLTVPADAEPTRPHWLRKAPSEARYAIPEGPGRVAPDTDAPLGIRVRLSVGGEPLLVERPVTHAVTDRVHGQRVEAVAVLPPVTVTPSRSARLVPVGEVAELPVTVRAHGEGPAEATVHVEAPPGWSVAPDAIDVSLQGGHSDDVVLTLTPPPDAPRPEVPLTFRVGDQPAWRVDVIDHPHLPRRPVLRPARVHAVPVDLARGDVEQVAYVQGSGDAVDRALTDLGYEVRGLSPAALRHALSTDTLTADALVFGIRAFNTHPELLDLLPAVGQWVAGGRVALVQYNTSARWTVLPPLGPGEVTLHRGRVTDEAAAVGFVDPDDPVITTPNPLSEADFDGWVQERGLYFAESWADGSRGVFELADPDEPPTTGALVVTPHGDGAFVYGGLSWFRQLPAGVPGAARLLANVLALSAPTEAE